MNKPTYLLAILLALVLLSCAQEQILTPDSSTSFKLNAKFSSLEISEDNALLDLAYGSHDQQRFDLYLPDQRSANITKVVIVLHGGAWQNGDKAAMQDIVSALRTDHPNLAVANANFVLANDKHYAFPNQFQDIDLLINYLSANSQLFEIKPEFAIIGRSSGGHLALMYDYAYDQKNQVTAVGSISGPTDFTDPFYQNMPNFNDLFDILVDPNYYANDADVLKTLSPMYRVDETSSPTILFHGTSDNVVPFSNAANLKLALVAQSTENKLSYNNEGHGNWSEPSQLEMRKELTKFLNQHFKHIDEPYLAAD